MTDRILSPFRRNDFTWKVRKQREENRTLKERFKIFIQRLKDEVPFEYDPDPDLEEVD